MYSMALTLFGLAEGDLLGFGVLELAFEPKAPRVKPHLVIVRVEAELGDLAAGALLGQLGGRLLQLVQGLRRLLRIEAGLPCKMSLLYHRARVSVSNGSA